MTSSNYEKVADISEIPKGSMKSVRVGSEEVALVNAEGKFYALRNRCTHMGGPLAKGKLDGFVVQRPWHGSKFDVRTGAVVGPPASMREPTFEVKLEGNAIMIRRPA